MEREVKLNDKMKALEQLGKHLGMFTEKVELDADMDLNITIDYGGGRFRMNINVQMNPGFKEVDRSRKRYIVMKGSAGSGKSVDTAQNYILRLMQDPGRNLLCVRKADVTNRDSTFAELQGAIFRMFGEQYKKYWHINSSNMIVECKINRNQIIFRGVNDEKQREKLKSITFKRGKLTDVWIEEATEITQADFEIIDDRLRGELPDGQFYQIRIDVQPGIGVPLD